MADTRRLVLDQQLAKDVERLLAWIGRRDTATLKKWMLTEASKGSGIHDLARTDAAVRYLMNTEGVVELPQG